MKKSFIFIVVIVSIILLVGCGDKPTLKGSYQNDKDVNGYFIQLSVNDRENTFVLYINNREVNSGTYEKEEDNLYKMSGDVQEFQVKLEEDNSFDIIVTGVSNDFPIKMKNLSTVPTNFPRVWGDEDEYTKLLFENFKSESLENDQGYQNCLEYINNSSFDLWENININIVKSQKVTEEMEEYVFVEKGKEDLLDTSDLVYTIGDTSGHNFANIVCDSETNEVIGYIPIK